jgi:putative transcriptional regulator
MRIKEFRIKAGLTQVELAAKLGVEQAAVSQWETGKTMPSAAILLKLSEELKCQIDELFKKGA